MFQPVAANMNGVASLLLITSMAAPRGWWVVMGADWTVRSDLTSDHYGAPGLGASRVVLAFSCEIKTPKCIFFLPTRT
eukprot:SAG11_NODE_571_length_8451_cov_34.938218_8_plen_78_part_00